MMGTQGNAAGADPGSLGWRITLMRHLAAPAKGLRLPPLGAGLCAVDGCAGHDRLSPDFLPTKPAARAALRRASTKAVADRRCY